MGTTMSQHVGLKTVPQEHRVATSIGNSTAPGQVGGTLEAWLLREENHAPLVGGGLVNRDHELGALRRVAPLREVRLLGGHANRVLLN